MNLKARKIFHYIRPFADYKNNNNYNLLDVPITLLTFICIFILKPQYESNCRETFKRITNNNAVPICIVHKKFYKYIQDPPNCV